jgi:hypothetical protein
MEGSHDKPKLHPHKSVTPWIFADTVKFPPIPNGCPMMTGGFRLTLVDTLAYVLLEIKITDKRMHAVIATDKSTLIFNLI